MHSGRHDHHRHPSKGASCVPVSATGYALRQFRNAGFSSCLSRFLTLNVARHGASKNPVFTAHSYTPEGILRRIVVYLQPAVVGISEQLASA